MNKTIGTISLVALLAAGHAGAQELETARWQAEIDAAAARGGGRVTVPAGRHVVGQLDLRSNVELHLAKGAVLEGAVGLEHYRVVELPYSEGTWSAVVAGFSVTNVAITGEGEIFGNGAGWPQPRDYSNNQEGTRARGIVLADSRDIRLEGFALRDAACWGIVLKCCDGVVARRVRISSHANANNDGFDIEARNVLVEDCDVDASDDAFCIKSNDPGFATEHIRIRNCVGRSHCVAYKLGTASHGIMRDIRFEHCRALPPRRFLTDLRPHSENYRRNWFAHHGRSAECPNGFGISALAVECVDGGATEDIVCRDIEARGYLVPIFVRGGTRTGRGCGTPPGNLHRLRNVLIEDVRGVAEGAIASSVTGVDGCRAANVRLVDVDIACRGAGEERGREAMAVPVPEIPGATPYALMFDHLLPAYGLYADRTDGLELRRSRFRLVEGAVDPRPAVLCTDRCKGTIRAGGLSVRQDRADALYRCGEKARLTVTAFDGASGEPLAGGAVAWRLDNGGSRQIASGTADLAKGNPFTVEGALDEPGFLRLTATCGTNRVVWGVGYDVGRIRQTEPRPADFDAYWRGEARRLRREVPTDARCTRDERLCRPGFDGYRLSFATFAGKRVYGFMSVPKEAWRKPYGVLFEVPGAGAGYVTVPYRKGWISVIMNVHTFECGASEAEQRALMERHHAELAKRHGCEPRTYCASLGIAASREEYAFHDVLLGIDRALDWVAERPDADPRRIVYEGSSQGGGFGLYLSYLNRHLRKAVVAVPAMTGHFGWKQGRQNGWPNLLGSLASEKRAAAERNAGYFDAINFAAGVRIPIRFIVGFADTTCPPADVYSAYNACPSSDKQICHAIGSPHFWYTNPHAAEALEEYHRFLGIAEGPETGFRVVRDIPYHPAGAYTNDWSDAYCRLDLRIPRGATNFATVVWFHGGGIVNGSRGDFCPAVGEGVAGVSAGYRLLRDGKAQPADSLRDAAAAVAWTLRHIAEYGGDPRKVFVSGHSAGGYLTMMVGMDPKLLAAHGFRPTDLAGLFPQTGQTSTHFTIRDRLGDRTPTYLTRADEWAPLSYASRDLPPMLVMTGEPSIDIFCRAEENALLCASLMALKHPDVEGRAYWGRRHDSMPLDAGDAEEDFVRRRIREIDGAAFSGGPNRIRACLERARADGAKDAFVSVVSSPDGDLERTCVPRNIRIDEPMDGAWMLPLLERIARANRVARGEPFPKKDEPLPAGVDRKTAAICSNAVEYAVFSEVTDALGMPRTKAVPDGNGARVWQTSGADAIRLAQAIARDGVWHGRRVFPSGTFSLPFAFGDHLVAREDGSARVLLAWPRAADPACWRRVFAEWKEEPGMHEPASGPRMDRPAIAD